MQWSDSECNPILPERTPLDKVTTHFWTNGRQLRWSYSACLRCKFVRTRYFCVLTDQVCWCNKIRLISKIRGVGNVVVSSVIQVTSSSCSHAKRLTMVAHLNGSFILVTLPNHQSGSWTYWFKELRAKTTSCKFTFVFIQSHPNISNFQCYIESQPRFGSSGVCNIVDSFLDGNAKSNGFGSSTRIFTFTFEWDQSWAGNETKNMTPHESVGSTWTEARVT